MMRTIFVPAVFAALLALAASSQVYAYGTVSRSATYTNPNTGRSGTPPGVRAMARAGFPAAAAPRAAVPTGPTTPRAAAPTRPLCTTAIRRRIRRRIPCRGCPLPMRRR